MMLLLSWAVFLLIGAAFTLAGVRIHARHPEAGGASLFDRVMADRRMRAAILVCWWWLGWHFLAGQTL